MSESIRTFMIRSQEIISQLCDGELTEEQALALTHIDLNMPVAVDRAKEIMDYMDSNEGYFKEKAEAYSIIVKRIKAAKERMKEGIKEGMKQLDLTELKGKDHRFKLSASKPSLIFNEDLLDKNYFVQTIVTSPDKDKIRKDLEAGLEVDGAMLMPSFSLRAYANTKDAK